MDALKYLEDVLQEAKSNKFPLVMKPSREEAIVNNLITLKTAQFSVDGRLLTLYPYISCAFLLHRQSSTNLNLSNDKHR
jgi:hypothetical protein